MSKQRVWIIVAVVVAFIAGWASSLLQGHYLSARMSGSAEMYDTCKYAGFTDAQCMKLVKPML